MNASLPRVWRTLCCLWVLLPLSIFAQNAHPDAYDLTQGAWWRFSTDRSGPFVITYETLITQQLISGPIPIDKIGLFTKKPGPIPAKLNLDQPDIYEIPVAGIGLDDGYFGSGDALLFYLSAETDYVYSLDYPEGRYWRNPYVDQGQVFMTLDRQVGSLRRITTEQANNVAEPYVNNVKARYRHEKELRNLFRSSNEWFGEALTESQTVKLQMSLPNLIISKPIKLTLRAVTTAAADLNIKIGSINNRLTQVRDPYSGEHGLALQGSFEGNLSSDWTQIELTYQRRSQLGARGFLDFFEITYWRELKYDASPLRFQVYAPTGDLPSMSIAQVPDNALLWRITDPERPVALSYLKQNNQAVFKESSRSVQDYIVFHRNAAIPVSRFDSVPLNTLASERSIDYLIVTPPVFRAQAERLADYHRSTGLEVMVEEPQVFYDAYAAGSPDPGAIRRFLAEQRQEALSQGLEGPKYLLLFGGASYDYKNRVERFKNFVPCYQTSTALVESRSIASDDQYGFLDAGEDGEMYNDRMDIAIGRLPATNIQEATDLTDKILRYAGYQQAPAWGTWRRQVTHIADDGVSEPFIQTYESLPRYFEADYEKNFSAIQVEKLYFDAYPQQTTPSGARYPDVRKAFLDRMDKGALLINYEGHSGEDAWSDEKVLQAGDIPLFTNKDALPAIFAASCSFSRYDDPDRFSGGELFVLNPRGGAIATVAASRVAFTSPNDMFHGAFNHHLLDQSIRAPRFGDAIMLAKNELGNSFSLKPFLLLGDPALRVALPEHRVEITHVNKKSVEDPIDTLKALSLMSIEGRVSHRDGQTLETFNGRVFVTVLDKKTQHTTLGNRNSTGGGNNPVLRFNQRKSVIYSGSVQVKNGLFVCEFHCPKDIAYQYGLGRILFYAHSDSSDAMGSFENLVIGGFSDDFDHYADAPQLNLYLFDTNFRQGSITNADPLVYARINDPYGINFTGTGIGHDMTAILDEDTRNPIVVNSYFTYLPESHTQGELLFPLRNLSPGEHRLRLKVWNSFNISTEQSITFRVYDSKDALYSNLAIFPNPAVDHVRFDIQHNAPGGVQDLLLQIFFTDGRPAATIQVNTFSEQTALIPVEWDLRTGQGQRLAAGYYIVRAILRHSDGRKSVQTSKLLIQ